MSAACDRLAHCHLDTNDLALDRPGVDILIGELP